MTVMVDLIPLSLFRLASRLSAFVAPILKRHDVQGIVRTRYLMGNQTVNPTVKWTLIVMTLINAVLMDVV